MNTMNLKSLLIFATGVVTGSLATYKFVKKKYEMIADEEIESVKKAFSNKDAAEVGKDVRKGLDEGLKEENEKAKQAAQHIAEQAGYTNYSNLSKKDTEEEEKEEKMNRPYVISPDEFGDEEDYIQVDLTYYADGIVADEDNEIVEDIDEIIGFDSLNHFGEYEDDAVYVRNDARRAEYAVVRDNGTYKDSLKYSPQSRR